MKEHLSFSTNEIPTLSIIIPAYNVEDYITETLDSILAQTRSPNEIIIINDGSTDNTSVAIKSHPLFKKIQLVETKNSGQGHARNVGISKATSDYMYFCDADDLLVNDCIFTITESLRKNQYPDIFLFSGKSFIDSRFLSEQSGFDYERSFKGFFRTQADFLTALMIEPELSCSPCLYASKRSLWSSNKLKFNSHYHEDEVLFYPLLFSASSYLISKDVLFLRRIRNNSIMTQTKTSKHVIGLENLLLSLTQLLKQNKSNHLRSSLIRRRLGNFSLSYIVTSKEVGKNLNLKLLLNSMYYSRNINKSQVIFKFLIKQKAKSVSFKGVFSK